MKRLAKKVGFPSMVGRYACVLQIRTFSEHIDMFSKSLRTKKLNEGLGKVSLVGRDSYIVCDYGLCGRFSFAYPHNRSILGLC